MAAKQIGMGEIFIDGQYLGQIESFRTAEVESVLQLDSGFQPLPADLIHQVMPAVRKRFIEAIDKALFDRFEMYRNGKSPYDYLVDCCMEARTIATLMCPPVCVEVSVKPYYTPPQPYKRYVVKGLTDACHAVGYNLKKYMLIFQWSGILMEPVLMCSLPTVLLPRRFTVDMSIN